MLARLLFGRNLMNSSIQSVICMVFGPFFALSFSLRCLFILVLWLVSFDVGWIGIFHGGPKCLSSLPKTFSLETLKYFLNMDKHRHSSRYIPCGIFDLQKG